MPERRLIGESWAPEEMVQGSANRRLAYDEAFLKANAAHVEDVEAEDLGIQHSSHPDPKPHWVTRFWWKEDA